MEPYKFRFDPDAARRTLRLLYQPGDVFEARIPGVPRAGTVAGYFDFEHIDKALQDIEFWNGKGPAVFVTPNPVDPDLLARSFNRMKPFAKPTTTNDEIVRRRRILVDFDPKRRSGISSTDAEHEAALKRAREFYDLVPSLGIRGLILADSGNGAHDLIRVDLPNDKESTELVKCFLQWVARRFGDNVVKVDTGVFEAARLTKLYGTWVGKGDDIPERPHRISGILEVSERMEAVSAETLSAIISTSSGRPQLGIEQRSDAEFERTLTPQRSEGIDLERWLNEHRLEITKKKVEPDGRVVCELKNCPWDENHTNQSAFVMQFPDGHLFAKCHHTSCAGKGWGDLRDKVEPGWRNVLGPTLNADRLAEHFLTTDHTQYGMLTLRYHRGDYYEFRPPVYRQLPYDDVETALYRRVKDEYDRVARKSGNPVQDVTTAKMARIRLALKSKTIVPSSQDPPCWLDGEGPWPAKDVLPALNGLYHLPSLAAGIEDQLSPTPRFFSSFALDYEIDVNAPEPARWLWFMNEIWGHDPQCIATLQEWMGYCLTQDTSQHKILMMHGPTRSGKGTIARVMEGLVGPNNFAGPSFESFKGDFGMEPLLGKTLAVIPDARLRGHSGGVVERLLSISGEDTVTVARKNKTSVTCKLPTRLVLNTNELPRLEDASGAMVGRIILLKMTKSFLGKEDPTLTGRLLAERSGILMWAISGWKRLRERGRFVQPESGEELLSSIADLGSNVAAFVKECCEVRAIYEIPRQELYDAYLAWCQNTGINFPVPMNVFGRDLRAAVPSISDSQPRDGDERTRHYVGITLK